MNLKVPIIDLSNKDWHKDLSIAFKSIGFCYIKSHDVESTLISSFKSQMQSFFKQPHDEKMKFNMKNQGLSWRGYFPPKTELTAGVPDLKEGYYFGRQHQKDHPGVISGLAMHGENVWPNDELAAIVNEYIFKMELLARKLMEGVAKGLNLNSNYFQKRFGSDETILLRAFNYPAQEKYCSEWGVGEHTDMGFLTILYQDELGGLEVKSLDGKFIKVPPIEGTFIVNIGDMLEYWTHGIYRATIHRVKNVNNKDRISIPFFYDPGWNSKLSPINKDKLDKSELELAAKNRNNARWDGLSLHDIPENLTYGEFVWNKIKEVFPELANQ